MSVADLRITVRSLLRQPVFTTVAVLSLGLGISLNATMYSVLDALIAPRVDIRDPAQIYSIQYYGNMKRLLSQATIDSTLLTGMRGYESFARLTTVSRLVVEAGTRYRNVFFAGMVDTTYFRLLGVHPRAGRIFGPSDLHTDRPPVIVSTRLASALFPNEDAVGKSILIDPGNNSGPTNVSVACQAVAGRSQCQRPTANAWAPQAAYGRYTIIGVLDDASNLNYYSMYLLAPAEHMHQLAVSVIRVRPGVKQAQVESELSVLAARLADAANESHKDTAFRLHNAGAARQFQLRAFDLALIWAVIAVLLVACSNLANLQLARGISRGRELAVRVAVGAKRADLVRHLFLESAVLAATGLITGLLLTLWGIHLVHATMPPRVADLVTDPEMNWHVVIVAIVASVVCALLIGLIPAIRVSRVDPNDLLKAGAGTGLMKRNRRQYGVLVAAEIGLALALLSGASVVLRTAVRLDGVKLSYDPHVLAQGTLTLFMPKGTTVHREAMSADIVSRVRSAPDVADAAAIGYGSAKDTVTVDDASGVPHQIPTPNYGYEVVTPGYLRTMQRPIIAGRDFLEGERDVRVVIVDELTSRFLFGTPERAAGHLIKMGSASSAQPYWRIVGVVKDQMDLSAVDRTRLQGGLNRLGEVLVNYTAADSSSVGGYMRATIVARASRNVDRLPLTLRHVLRDASRGWVDASPMDDILGITASRQEHHFVTALFAVFAIVGVSLAALGVYGIVAHGVAERKRELGVRIALGASRRDVLYAVLREGNVVALAGIALGLYLTQQRVHLLQTYATEADLYDAPFFAGVALVMFGVSVLAAFVPANRATKIDPVEAMRAE